MTDLPVSPLIESLEQRRLLAGDLDIADMRGNIEVVGDNAANGVLIETEITDEGISLLNGGTTSIVLDNDALAAANLRLVAADSTAEPQEGFDAGFEIQPTSTFRFEADGADILAGEARHTGSLRFDIVSNEDNEGNSDATDDIVLGNFIIGFDPTRVPDDFVEGQGGVPTGLFVADVSPGLDSDIDVLFDIATDEEGGLNVMTGDRIFDLNENQLLIAPEFTEALLGEGLIEQDITGTEVGTIRVAGNAAPIVNDLLSIRGLTRAGDFTTVNGNGTEALFRLNRIQGFNIGMRGGNDGVFFRDNELPAAFFADLGDGRDVLEFRDSFLFGTVDVDGGDGRDTFDIVNSTLSAIATDLGDGGDFFYLRNSSINTEGAPGEPFDIYLGEGDDQAQFLESLFLGDASIRGGEGDDFLYAEGSTLNRPTIRNFETITDADLDDEEDIDASSFASSGSAISLG